MDESSKNSNLAKILKKPELLAPAGDFQAFLGAVNAGADAVYLAGNLFGARAYAKNLSEEEIIEALTYAHAHGKKIYLTVNTLTKNQEGKMLYEFLKPLYFAGLDGVIVQDFGVFRFIHDVFPDLPIHVSTQMCITSYLGALKMKELGAVRVVPARELSLEEVRQIGMAGVETECFIHGSMCYSYSGQCLFSSFLGSRSGNRGRCAGPCRQPYIPEGENKEAYLLSLKDLCTLQILPKLIDAGISSFKIEGRMKSPAYAAGVSAIYRKYIDLYFESSGHGNIDRVGTVGPGGYPAEESRFDSKEIPCKNYQVDPADLNALKSLYLRSELQDGYYEKSKSREMVSIHSPSYNKTDEELSAGLTEKYCRRKEPVMLDVTADFTVGKPAECCLEFQSGKIRITGSEVLPARKVPLTKQELETRFNKSSNGLYAFHLSELRLSEDAFLPVGAINSMRRELEEKAADVLRDFSGRRVNPPEENRFMSCQKRGKAIADNSAAGNSVPDDIPRLFIFVSLLDQLSVLANQINQRDCLCIPSSFFREELFHATAEILKNISDSSPARSVYVVLPPVLREPNLDLLRNLIAKAETFPNIRGYYVSQPDSLKLIQDLKETKEVSPEKEIRGDLSFYMANNESVALFQKELNTYTLSAELSGNEISHMLPEHAQLAVYGRIPLMQTANCVLNTTGRCARTEKFVSVKDRMKTDFPIFTHCSRKICYNTIYNSVPLSLHKHMKSIVNSGIPGLQIRFTDESAKDCALVYHIFDNGRMGILPENVPYEFTNGHFVKGVL